MMSRNKRILWLGAATLVAAFFLGLRLWGKEKESVPKQAAEPNLFAFVHSLEGTQADGQVQADGDELVVSPELIRMFDYYLAAVGEQPLQAIRSEIERDIGKRLKGRAAVQAKQLLTRYLNFKRELVNVEQDAQWTGSSAAAIRGRFAAMQEIRLRYFSQKEIEAMFALDDANDLDTIARLEIAQDKVLSPEQKQQKLAALDASLPPALRQAREEPLRVVRLEESVAKMRDAGASDDEVYRMRAAALSPEAAARLADVDREEAEWKTRIAAYRSQRHQIMRNNPHLSETDREAYFEQLRQANFTPDEQKRLAAYE